MAKAVDSFPASKVIASKYPLSKNSSLSKSINTNCDVANVVARHESLPTKSATIPGRDSFEESPCITVSEQLPSSIVADLPRSSVSQQLPSSSFVGEAPLTSISNSVKSKTEPNSAVSMLISESADEISLRLQLAQGL